MHLRHLVIVTVSGLCAMPANYALANDIGDDHSSSCSGLPQYATLKSALIHARHQANGGFNLDMWATVVNRDGVVCAVAFTGVDRGSQWPGSRVISAQKANTGNAFSLPGLALSTANLYSAVSPGGSLYGLQHSNPVNTHVAYRGPAANYGLANDPMEGGRIGGVNISAAASHSTTTRERSSAGSVSAETLPAPITTSAGARGTNFCWIMFPRASAKMPRIRTTLYMTSPRRTASRRA
jgi:hypothetical protein